MACFIVPATEAVITTTVNAVLKHKEKKSDIATDNSSEDKVTHVPFSEKLSKLNKLLWGGSAILAFEHLWHGEITPWAPFLTAAQTKSDLTEMLHEMSTVGVGMAVLITGVWSVMLLVSHIKESKKTAAETKSEEESL